MRLRSLPTAASLVVMLIACGAEPPPAVVPAPSEPPGGSPVEIAKPAPTSAPAASTDPAKPADSAEPAAPAAPDDPKGPFKFSAYQGPKVKRTPATPKVWAPVWADIYLKPGKVTAVANDNTQYKVKFDEGGKEEMVDFDRVTAPLE